MRSCVGAHLSVRRTHWWSTGFLLSCTRRVRLWWDWRDFCIKHVALSLRSFGKQHQDPVLKIVANVQCHPMLFGFVSFNLTSIASVQNPNWVRVFQHTWQTNWNSRYLIAAKLLPFTGISFLGPVTIIIGQVKASHNAMPLLPLQSPDNSYNVNRTICFEYDLSYFDNIFIPANAGVLPTISRGEFISKGHWTEWRKVSVTLLRPKVSIDFNLTM